MPRVLIDLRMVRGRLHGIARYALELARRLPALAPRWDFEALVDPAGLPPSLGPLTPTLPQRRCRAPFLSPLEQPALAASLLRSGCDLFHATSFSLPALWPGRLVATLHDANHLALEEEYGVGRRAYYRLVVGPRAQRASALITVSDFSREELARHLSLSPYRLQVISPGVDAAYTPHAPTEVATFRKARGLPQRFLLAVGNVKPFKNLKLLAKAQLPLPIVLLAGAGAARALGFPEDTVELSEVPEAELPLLYCAAGALLLPSRYEGFGLPAAEAMACGCPVLAARAGSLPEVVGSAAWLLPVDEPQAWREAVLRLLRDEPGRKALSDAGVERSARYRWDLCAQQTLAVYERALARGWTK